MTYKISKADAIERVSDSIVWWSRSVYYAFLFTFAVTYWFGIVGMIKVIYTNACLYLVWVIVACCVMRRLSKQKKILVASTDELVEVKN